MNKMPKAKKGLGNKHSSAPARCCDNQLRE